MPFSISLIGKPAALAAKLEAQADKLSGTEKSDLATLLPAIATILELNVDDTRGWVMRLDVSADGTVVDGVRTYGRCNVSINTLGVLVE